jgi:hypothetical protein
MGSLSGDWVSPVGECPVDTVDSTVPASRAGGQRNKAGHLRFVCVASSSSATRTWDLGLGTSGWSGRQRLAEAPVTR